MHISYVQAVLQPGDEELHELPGQQVAELISLLLLSDTDGCKVPQQDATASSIIRSDTKPLYDYVKVIKIEMCYFDKWVGENHVGDVECACLGLMNGERSLHPEGVSSHTTQRLDVLICGRSANFIQSGA